jgi:hypothetical protein
MRKFTTAEVQTIIEADRQAAKAARDQAAQPAENKSAHQRRADLANVHNYTERNA